MKPICNSERCGQECFAGIYKEDEEGITKRFALYLPIPSSGGFHVWSIMMKRFENFKHDEMFIGEQNMTL